MKKQTVIFDFDGTIADSWPIIRTIIKEIAASYHVPMDENDIQQLRRLEYSDIIKMYHIPLWKIPALLIRGRVLFSERIKDVALFPSIPFVLQKLTERGIKIGVLTSNAAENVKRVLENHHISQVEFIRTANNLFGKDRALRKILNDYCLDPELTIYVGDETRDIDACHRTNIDIIAVSWGFNDQRLLKRHHPEFIVDQPETILQII